MAAFNLSSHGTQDLYPTFLKQDHGLDRSPNAVGWITAISQVGAIIRGLTFGFLSDRRGRRRFDPVGVLPGAVFCLPLWAFAPHGNLPLLALGGFMIQFMVQGAWGVVPAHLTELAPDNVRGFLPGFGYQCGALIAGALPYLQETMAKHYSRAWVMSATCLIVFVLGAVIVSLGNERKGILFGSKRPAGPTVS